MPGVLTLEGRVVTGMRIATNNLAPVLPLIRSRMGLPGLLPGTLNVRLAAAHRIRPDARLTREEYWGVEPVLLQRCRVAGLRCCIVRPESHESGAAHGPAHLEIMSERHLRTRLGLSDGSAIAIELEGDASWWLA